MLLTTLMHCCSPRTTLQIFNQFARFVYSTHFKIVDSKTHSGAVTCAVCPESAWLVTFLIGNVSTGVVTWSALRCGASGESGKKVAAAPLSKTAAAAAAAKTWFAKHPLDYMLHNRFPWKRSGRRSSMWPPYSLRRNLSAAACQGLVCRSMMLHDDKGCLLDLFTIYLVYLMIGLPVYQIIYLKLISRRKLASNWHVHTMLWIV